VQFVRPERLAVITGAAQPEIEWLDEADIAQRLGALREDHSAWRIPRDTGQFSLAGAQPKTALLLVNGRWGVPSGRIPTTHILKPRPGNLQDMLRTSISVWNSHAPSACRLSIQGSCISGMRSPSLWSDTIAFAQPPACAACIRKTFAKLSVSSRSTNTRMRADPVSVT